MITTNYVKYVLTAEISTDIFELYKKKSRSDTSSETLDEYCQTSNEKELNSYEWLKSHL